VIVDWCSQDRHAIYNILKLAVRMILALLTRLGPFDRASSAVNTESKPVTWPRHSSGG
jgi:hypothetical protein